MMALAPSIVDLVFGIQGSGLPRDNRFPLMREIMRCLPWFEAEADIGIHPVKSARADDGQLLLGRRAKLVLRLPEQRVAAAAALEGQVLDVAGSLLRVGAAHVRSLLPFGTLYAHFVVSGSNDELAFLDGIAGQLERLQTPCKWVCGRHQTLRAAERQLEGYSLMLHDLSPEHSLLLQQVGIGGERKLGCGILVPHKAVAAVGA
jgi:CRISPR-associated protein Cas6